MPRYLIAKDATCQVDKCTGSMVAKQYCRSHYMNLVRNLAIECGIDGCKSRRVSKAKPYCPGHLKDPDAPGKVKRARAIVTANDLKKQTEVNENGCWVWQGKTSGGYSSCHVRVNNRFVKSGHRAMYILVKGEVDPDMHIHHVCANRLCINPDHLAAEPAHRNIAEMHERHRYQKLIAEQAMEIHRLREKLDDCFCVGVR